MVTFLKWNQFGTTGSVFRATNLSQTSNLVSKVLEEKTNQMVTAECGGAEDQCRTSINTQNPTWHLHTQKNT